ncbi:MATH domain and coiled-coil domain-containing protein [Chlorella sorokiniana]|uniref:MATH domain and coiled-coil domain-containing protein n=1 Tax=Chlorella sorokiniana TaxID=3076 RepID=A0A2P6TVK2_CHLSO|nr:MATH domain and coiled-coil domain-containing protein [Chlorella sorokiniana]|eukprot:PRW58089.1 MATH domain and coiled-coil domain-containing protein [Chlorella sorokiniana]
MEASMPSDDGLPAFDKAKPQAYYLVENREEMEALSDAVLVAGGVSLPVHSQVLSMQSGVLRRMFVDFRGSQRSSGEQAGSSSQNVADKEGEFVLKEPLAGCSAHEGALFLRFCYRPEDMTQPSLNAVTGSLPALLRLAHKLEAGRMLQRLGQHMTEESAGGSTEELIAWTDAGEHCEQTDLRLACTAHLAQRLVARAPGSQNLAAGIADAEQLEGCSKRTLLLLLGLVTGAGRQLASAEQLLGYAAATNDEVTAAQQQARNPGTFEWRIAQFSQQPAQVGHALKSPWFSAGGRQCQLSAYLNGDTAQSEGHLSLYVVTNQDTARASVQLTLSDQDKEKPQDETKSYTEELTPLGRGYSKFVTLEKLRSRPGYLAGDALVIRAKVHVLL